MTDMSTNELVGKTVVTPDGSEVGSLEEVRFDPDQWEVTGLVVSLTHQVAESLRLETSMFGKAQLEVSPRRVQGVGDFVTLNVTLNELSDLVTRGQGTQTPARRT